MLSKRNSAEWIKIDNSDQWFYVVEKKDLNVVRVCGGSFKTYSHNRIWKYDIEFGM